MASAVSEVSQAYRRFGRLNFSSQATGGIVGTDERSERMRRLLDRVTRLSRFQLPWKRGISLETSAVFFREMSILCQSGVPLDKALAVMGKELDARDPLARVVTRLWVEIRSGFPLSRAMSRFPALFTPHAVAIVAAGEAGGTLDRALGRLADSYEARLRVARALRAALFYPALVLLLSLGIVLALLQFALPPFLQIFAAQNIQVPPLTQGFLWLVGIAASPYFLVFMVISLFGIAVFVRNLLEDPENRKLCERTLLRLPVVGRFLTTMAAARFCQSLGELYGSGIGVVQGLRYTATMTGSLLAQEELGQITYRVIDGDPLSRAVRESQLFPPLVASMLSVAERTGQLEPVLAKAAAYFQRDLALAGEQLQRILEPVVLCVLGVLMTLFMLVFFLPIYSSLGSFGG